VFLGHVKASNVGFNKATLFPGIKNENQAFDFSSVLFQCSTA